MQQICRRTLHYSWEPTDDNNEVQSCKDLESRLENIHVNHVKNKSCSLILQIPHQNGGELFLVSRKLGSYNSGMPTLNMTQALFWCLANLGSRGNCIIQVLRDFLKLNCEVNVMHMYREGNSCAEGKC